MKLVTFTHNGGTRIGRHIGEQIRTYPREIEKIGFIENVVVSERPDR